MDALRSIRDFFRKHRINNWAIFFFLVYVILVIKIVSLKELESTNAIFVGYSIIVAFYILSRFALAYFYAPSSAYFDASYEPTVTFGVPAKNEGENIRETILRIAKSDYPKDKFNIIAVNDGSTDNTLAEMLAAKRAASRLGVRVEVVNWQINRGKREGMAECVRRSTNDIMVFIDSDSFVEKDTVRELVKYFRDPAIGAVAGHATVANADANILTKMQSLRYFVAFKAYKAAESLFGSVTCCSGCCAAYRREYIADILDEWLHQTFLGVKCTFGDDRSLTNFILKKNYRAVFAPNARSQTFVPDTLSKYLRQQLRWKKSWIRESFRASAFMWKKHPLMSISFYLGLILPLIAPVIALRAIMWYPYATGNLPAYYLIGLMLMGILYGLYYYIYTRDSSWFLGVVFTSIYALLLIWQLPYAMLTIRDPKWGTR